MKRMHFALTAALAALTMIVSGCNRELERPESLEGAVLRAALETAEVPSRVAFADDGAFSWSEGDAVAVITDAGIRTMTLTGGAGAATASFEGDLSGATSASAAIFPAAVAKDATTITLPDHYTYREGQTNALMLASSPDLSKTVTFKHLGGIIKVVYESIPAEADAFVLKASSKITGDFLFSMNAVAPDAAAGAPKTRDGAATDNQVTITFPAGSNPKAFYVPVPTGTYTFSVELQKGGVVIEGTQKATSSPKTIARRTLLLMDPVAGAAPSAEYLHQTAKWFNTSSTVSSGLSGWTGSNQFFASQGEGANKAYISTFKGNTGSNEPVRTSENNRLSVANIAEGDGLLFTWPGQTLAAGTAVDFMASLMTPNGSAPKYWIFEYWDDGAWKTVEQDLLTASEDATLRYSFYVKYFSAYQYTTFTQSFTLSKALDNEDLKVRIRAVGRFNNAGGSLSPSAGAYLSIVNSSWQGARLDTYQGCPAKDVKKTLVLGNSFTYYYGTDFLLKEIARTQGHELRMRTHIKGSQTFYNHTQLERSQAAIADGDFDFALLQDQSNQHAAYYADPATNASILNDTKTLLGQIKAKSPAVQPVIEQTWAYAGSSNNYNGYGSYEVFDKALLGGALLITDATDTWMSPVGVAFEKARAAGISLYHTDNKHPGLNGAYLKACVNYLILFGEPFDAHAPDCTVPAATAKKLRDIAEEVVIGHVSEYRNPDASTVVPGEGMGGGGEEIDPSQVTPGENGIRTPEQLRSFAYVYNNGGDISSYCNAAGEVVLLEDIELPGTRWEPIGTVSGVNYADMPTVTSGFKGVFDGQGHTITGLTLVVDSNQFTTMGFFGATHSATIRNVRFEDVTLTANSSGISSNMLCIGTVVGCALDTHIEQVSVAAAFSGKMTSTAARHVSVGGVAGVVASSTDNASTLTDVRFEGTMTNDLGTKYSNTNSSIIGGICGGIPNGSGCKTVTFLRCVNDGDLDVKAHRVAGITSGCTHAHVESCTNNGAITVSQSASAAGGSVTGCRVGGITAYCSSTSANNYYVKDCENTGTITVPEGASYVGGIGGIYRTYTVIGCRNRGNIYAKDATRGLLVGCITSANVETTFSDCHIRGRIGPDAASAKEATPDNYLSLGISFNGGTAATWNAENVHFLAE